MSIRHFERLAVLLGALAAAPATPAQERPVTWFSDAQLEQMAAPIALYPDALLMQVLMAATYPIEIVQADRWVQTYPGLSGDALEDALRYRDWDPSVKSLCSFPDVLRRLDENLDWTQDLGDAFIGQQMDLLEAVQRLRAAARRAGNLPDGDPMQRVIVQEDRIIVIEPARPEVIYVPVYYPVVIYGPAWTYPRWYYPHLFLPPPPGVRIRAFSLGITVGAAIWGGCRWSWGHHEVHIDIDRYRRFTRVATARPERYGIISEPGGWGRWQHDPGHRKGVGYRDPEIARRFEKAGGVPTVTRDQARGFPPRPSAPAPAPRGREIPSTGSAPAARDGGTVRPGSAPTPASPGSPAVRSRLGPDTAFTGTAQPKLDRAASARGATSRTGSVSRSANAPGKTAAPRSGTVPRADDGRKR